MKATILTTSRAWDGLAAMDMRGVGRHQLVEALRSAGIAAVACKRGGFRVKHGEREFRFTDERDAPPANVHAVVSLISGSPPTKKTGAPFQQRAVELVHAQGDCRE